MTWTIINKGSKKALELADRHYTRQTPGSNQFCRPGKNLVLLSQDERSLWVTWSGIRDDGYDAWECTIFRNEGRYLSSHLITLAVGVTLHEWGAPPQGRHYHICGKPLKRRMF